MIMVYSQRCAQNCHVSGTTSICSLACLFDERCPATLLQRLFKTRPMAVIRRIGGSRTTCRPRARLHACSRQSLKGRVCSTGLARSKKKTADGISKIAPPTRMAVGSSTAWAFKIDTVLHMLPE